MTPEQILATASELANGRGPATIFDVMARAPDSEARAAADIAARAVGLQALGARWAELDREAAMTLLVSLLSRDLAYDAPMLEPAVAELYAGKLFAAVGSAAYFSNGYNGTSWHPAADATFDAGIIAVGVDRVGILWVRDED